MTVPGVRKGRAGRVMVAVMLSFCLLVSSAAGPAGGSERVWSLQVGDEVEILVNVPVAGVALAPETRDSPLRMAIIERTLRGPETAGGGGPVPVAGETLRLRVWAEQAGRYAVSDWLRETGRGEAGEAKPLELVGQGPVLDVRNRLAKGDVGVAEVPSAIAPAWGWGYVTVLGAIATSWMGGLAWLVVGGRKIAEASAAATVVVVPVETDIEEIVQRVLGGFATTQDIAMLEVMLLARWAGRSAGEVGRVAELRGAIMADGRSRGHAVQLERWLYAGDVPRRAELEQLLRGGS